MTQKRWKKTEAEQALAKIAEVIAERFGVEAPAVEPTEYRTGRDWEVRVPDMVVWTKAGRAKMNVTIDANFAHLYFQFDETPRATALIGTGDRSLNRHSAKWNEIVTPEQGQYSLDIFTATLSSKFRKVAEKSPAPEEIEAAAERDQVRDAHWAQMRAEMDATNAAPEDDSPEP